MNRQIITVIKKEFARFFGDRRMVITALIFPGLLIYVMYSFMGQGMAGFMAGDADHVPVVYSVNMPASLSPVLESFFPVLPVETNAATVKTDISSQSADLLMVFPLDFDNAVARYDSLSGLAAPQVELYYNSASADSLQLYSQAAAVLDAYESSLANKFDVNGGADTYDLATARDTASQFFAMMLPLLIMVMMYAGCMSIAIDSIAGEKERGTFATILVTPLTGGQLAAGKILSLGALAFLCGLSSVAGIMLSLPKMLGDTTGGILDISMNIYGPAEYGLLILVVLSTVLLMVTVISLLALFSKSVKEAQSAVLPLYILVILAALASLLGGGGAVQEFYYYLIPFYNSAQSMVGIFTFDYDLSHIALAVGANLCYILAGGFILARMFSSEKVMFSK